MVIVVMNKLLNLGTVQSSRPALSLVIVSFNSKEVLRECLKSLLAGYSQEFANKDYELILIDNASSDGSVEMIKGEFPQVELIEAKENLGFAKANNLGIKKSQGRLILFLNPDTIVQSDTLSTMINYIDSEPSVGVATCLVELSGNRGIDLDCHRGFPTPWASFCYFTGLEKLFPRSRIFGQYHQTWKDLSTIHEIDSAVGAFMLVKREVGEKIGWWDEDFFFYGEDLDFCFRVKEMGLKVMYNPTVKIYHYKGISSGIQKGLAKESTATAASRQKALNASVDAMKMFYAKHYQGKYPRIVDLLVNSGTEILRVKRLISGKR